ncbi:hypothetical protein IC575_017777 [Cucumis melo]
MHRKFRQNNGQVPLKEFVNGQQTSDEQQYFPRTSTNNPFKQAHRDLDIARTDEDYEDESLISISEIFPGFLAIGTFGSSEPATPKFSISIDHITESDQTEVTKNELKLINDELEKVLRSRQKTKGGRGRTAAMRTKSRAIIIMLRVVIMMLWFAHFKSTCLGRRLRCQQRWRRRRIGHHLGSCFREVRW